MKQNITNGKHMQQKLFNNKSNIHTKQKIVSHKTNVKNNQTRPQVFSNQNKTLNPRLRKVRTINKSIDNNSRRISLQRSVIPQKNQMNINLESDNIKNNIVENNKYYSLKEIIKLGIDFSKTKKVFINGESRYVVDEEIFNNANNLNLENKEIIDNKQLTIDDMFVNDEASDVNDAHYDYEQENVIDEENNLVQENDSSKIISNIEFINQSQDISNDNQNIEQSEEVSVYDDEFHHVEEDISDPNAIYDVQDLNYNNNSNQYFDDVDYVQEYYDDTFQDTFEQIEYDKQIDYEEKIRPLQIVKNWNKKLWRQEDVLYKIYNISFNQNHDDPYAGCLYNFSFDIYPGDRIAILSHDSMSDLLLLDILKNYVQKDSGYVFFNLKREQKWFDIYSSEYDGFDIEMYNRRYEAIYQLQSPDYFAYGKNKNDTVDSTFKKIFNTIKQVINEKLFSDLLYLLDFEKELDSLISSLDDLKARKFIFICDVLIGKKIIIMSNLTEGFDITQKISFYRYINALYQDSDTVIIFNVKDSFEVKLLANRLIIIDDGEPVVNKRIKDILNTFETLDTFIVEAFDKLHKKYL